MCKKRVLAVLLCNRLIKRLSSFWLPRHPI